VHREAFIKTPEGAGLALESRDGIKHFPQRFSAGFLSFAAELCGMSSTAADLGCDFGSSRTLPVAACAKRRHLRIVGQVGLNMPQSAFTCAGPGQGHSAGKEILVVLSET